MLRHKIALGLCTALAAGVAGCGGDDSGSGAGSGDAAKVGGATKTEIPTDAKKGGDLTMLAAGDIDWADPGQTYYQFGYQVHDAVSRRLYAFKPDSADAPTPDLAKGAPQVSEDQKTITIKLRTGVKFAPPVDREVTSKDIKYAMERTFTSNVPNGYSAAYWSTIEGAPQEPVAMKDLEPFSGLQTPDDQTLVIKLTEPKAALVTGALVLPGTAPVPEEYAKKYDAKSPTDYDQYAVATGPYMIENDESGKLTGRDPGKEIKLVRNPNWVAETDFRPAYLDTITIEEGNADEVVSNRRTLSGENLVCCDSSTPPAQILARVLRNNADQVGRAPSGGAHWDPFNTQKPPFDNINIRKAVIANADRFAIRKVNGGEAIGPIQQSYIPPGIPGHEESGGTEGFPELDFMQCADGGCPDVAKKYMDLAEKDGADVTGGKYTGPPITLVVNNTPDGKTEAEVTAGQMEELGFKVKIRQVEQGTLYTKFLGVPEQQPEFAVGVGWVKDFQDAQTLLSPIFPSDTIQPAGNVNWSQLKVPEVDKAIAAAEAKPAGPERDEAFAKANKAVTEQAPALPITWTDNIQLSAKNVRGVMNLFNGSWDFNYTSIK